MLLRVSLALLALLAVQVAQAQTFDASELQPGDVLLQPLDCWSCTLIEEEESSIYSHAGMVLETAPEIRVIEALGIVREISLEAFAARTQQEQKIRVLRLRDPRLQAEFIRSAGRLRQIYRSEFHGLPYDHQFLWDNRTAQGIEPIYCAELVAKLHARFLGVLMPLKRMHFDRNVEEWKKYFHGEPPRGEWGLSPGDLERSSLFVTVGELN